MAYQSRLEIVIDSRSGEAGLRRINQSLEQTERKGEQVESRFDGMGQSLSSLRGIALAASGALTAIVGSSAIRQIAGSADAYAQMSGQLRLVEGSADAAAERYQELLEVAQDTRSALEPTVDLYARLRRSTDGLGLSSQDMLRITGAINNSFIVSGASADEASNAIRQLSQGLAAGALRGDEFNSVAENSPRLARAIAESLGITVGELREFAAEGGVTGEVIANSLLSRFEELRKEADLMPRTIGQAAQAIRNELQDAFGRTDVQPLTEAMGELQDVVADPAFKAAVIDLSSSLVGGVTAMANGIQYLDEAATILSGVFAGRLAGSLVTTTGGFIAAQREAMRYQAALATMAGVSRTAAVSQVALGTAARGAAGALALVGGPLGAAVLAVGALYAFRQELGLVAAQAETTQGRISGLTRSLSVMGEAAIASSIASVEAELRFLEDQAWNTQAAIAQLGKGETFGGQTKTQLEDQLESIAEDVTFARQELARLKRQSDELQNPGGEGGGFESTEIAASGASSEVDKLAQSYQTLYDRLRPVEAMQRQYAQDKATLVEYALRENMATAELQQLLADLENSYRNAESAAEVYGFTGEAANKKISDSARDLGFTFSSAFEDAIVKGEDFRTVLDGILQDILRIAVRKSVSEPVGNAIAGFDWGSLFGSGSTATGGTFGGGSVGNPLGYSEGGWTGPGSKHDPAGIVHAGEFVVKKSVVEQPGVRGFLENLNTKGYANGGYVGSSSSSAATAGTTVQIIDQRSSGEKPQVEESRGVDGRKLIKVLIRDELKSAMTDGSMDRTMANARKRWN